MALLVNLVQDALYQLRWNGQEVLRCGNSFVWVEINWNPCCGIVFVFLKADNYSRFLSDVDHHLVMHIVGEHSQLEKSSKHVELCWIPSHVGITGNGKADAAAKAALSQQSIYSKLPPMNFIVLLNGKSLGTPVHQTNYMQLFQLLVPMWWRKVWVVTISH